MINNGRPKKSPYSSAVIKNGHPKKKKNSLLTRSSNDPSNIQKDLQKVDTKESKTKQVKKIS